MGKFQFCKENLKSGHVVKRKEGTFAIVLGNKTYSTVGYSDLIDYNDDLDHSCCRDLDIIAIYEPGFESIHGILRGNELTLIAERPVKEMTLAEICKKLGYNVKIVKEE